MAVYGRIHQVADFVARSVSKDKAPFTHELIEMLKAIGELQERNALVTIGVQTGDGLRIVYEGLFLSLLIPQQKHVRVMSDSVTVEGKKLREILKTMVELKQAILVENEEYDYWRVFPGSIGRLTAFSLALKGSSKGNTNVRGGHPRTFPGAVRETALFEFEKGGRWCPGVKRPRHKVDLACERIAFDHILPFARGGSSSPENIQVLCQTCNLQKRATALGNAAS